MRIGQPGMNRPHRHLDRECGEKGQEQELLRRQRQRQRMPGGDVETAARLEVEIDDRHQCEQRAQQGVEEELERRVDAVLPTPHADDDEHRNQGGLEKHVKQRAVEGREHPDHEPGQDEKRSHVLRHPGLDHLPSGQHHQHGDECGQRDEEHRNAVDPEVILDAKARDPVVPLDELELRRRGVEIKHQRQRNRQARQSADAREASGQRRVTVAASGEHHQARQYRHPDGKA